MISMERIARIRERTNLSELMAMQPGHQEHVCPFCGEKRLRINEETRLYHCWACKETGDCFTYVQRRQGLTFAEAVAVLDQG